MNNELHNQMKNKVDAINAAKDFIDCFFKATPEFKEQIGRETVGLLIAKSQINAETNLALNKSIETNNVLTNITYRN